MTSEFDRFIDELQKQVLEETRGVYSDTVIDHWMRPRNYGPMENADGYARLTGPCGDTMEIFIRVDSGRITNASFLTDGCGTSIASGSMAVDMAIGKTLPEAMLISQQAILEKLGGLPEETEHCALLASNTLRSAIDDYLRIANEPWKKLYRKT